MTMENLVILFSDVVGSTQLSHLEPPEAADELRRQHFAILRQALTEAGGIEVKNLGDGLMVVFGSASAGLACAVAMQQAVDHDNRGRRHPDVGLRLGLSGGEVIADDDDYWGDPVIEAARLCALCDGGQILAANIVPLTAGRRSRHQYRNLGPLNLKGLPDPVECVEVLWEPFAAVGPGTPIPLPARLPVRPGSGVIGREMELSVIGDAVKSTGVGDVDVHRALLISGEAGQGKTTLVAEAARSAFDGGSCVLFGHCEQDLATPYQLFAEALGHFVAHAPEEQLLAHVAANGSELARLLPPLASRIPDLPPTKATDADTERYLLFAAVIELLAQISREQPVVLVLDDLQWADRGSLLLLRHILATDQPLRVLIIGTYRDSELSPTHPLLEALAGLRRMDRITRIELAGLDDSGVVAFMEAIAGYALDDAAIALAHAVYRDTDGNPFFVSELLRHLSETGFIYQDATGRWVTDHPLKQITLPKSVHEVIGARVGRLGADAGTVLSLAAVIGRDFDLELLSGATKRSADELLDILDAASHAALVRELAQGRFAFVHALIQHTLYEDLGPSRQGRAHRSIAEALETMCGDRPGSRVGELARHWLSANHPVDLAKALDYSRMAGDAALSALAPANALRHYRNALDLYGSVPGLDRLLAIDLAIGLGTAQRQTGDPAYRDTLLGAARLATELRDTGRLVKAALANDRGFYSAVGAIDADKVEILEAAAATLVTPSADRALVLATLCSELAHGSTLGRRQALADEAIAIADSLDDEAVMVRVLNHIHIALQVPSLLEASLDRTALALRLAERVGDPVQLFWAAQWRAEAAARDGDMEEMLRCIAIHGSMAEQLNQPILNWGHAFVSAVPAQIAGDTDRAEAMASEALRIGTECGQPDAATIFGAQLIIVCGQRGTMSDLTPLIEQMAADTPDISPWLFRSLLAKAYVEGDRFEDALELLEEFAKANFDLPQDQIWLTGMVDFADAAIECRDPGFAGPLFDRLEAWASQIPATGGSALAPVSLYLGGLATVLGRYEEAEAYLAQSARFCARADAKFFGARTDLSLGKLLAERRAAGDLQRARMVLLSVQATAAELGYGAVARRASETLRSLD